MRNPFRDRHEQGIHSTEEGDNEQPDQANEDNNITSQTVMDALRELTGHVVEKPKKTN